MYKDMNENEIENIIERLYRRLDEEIHPHTPLKIDSDSIVKPEKCTPLPHGETLWERLVTEGNHKLIEKLHRAEHREPGYSTIAVPLEGFSEDDTTHNAILDWLKEKNIKTINPLHEAAALEKALKG